MDCRRTFSPEDLKSFMKDRESLAEDLDLVKAGLNRIISQSEDRPLTLEVVVEQLKRLRDAVDPTHDWSTHDWSGAGSTWNQQQMRARSR